MPTSQCWRLDLSQLDQNRFETGLYKLCVMYNDFKWNWLKATPRPIRQSTATTTASLIKIQLCNSLVPSVITLTDYPVVQYRLSSTKRSL